MSTELDDFLCILKRIADHTNVKTDKFMELFIANFGLPDGSSEELSQQFSYGLNYISKW